MTATELPLLLTLLLPATEPRLMKAMVPLLMMLMVLLLERNMMMITMVMMPQV